MAADEINQLLREVVSEARESRTSNHALEEAVQAIEVSLGIRTSEEKNARDYGKLLDLGNKIISRLEKDEKKNPPGAIAELKQAWKSFLYTLVFYLDEVTPEKRAEVAAIGDLLTAADAFDSAYAVAEGFGEEEEQVGGMVDSPLREEEEEEYASLDLASDPFVNAEFSEKIAAAMEKVSQFSDKVDEKKRGQMEDYMVARHTYNYLVGALDEKEWEKDNPGEPLPQAHPEEHVPDLAEIDEEQVLDMLDLVSSLEKYDNSAESLRSPVSHLHEDRLCALTGNRAPFVSPDILGKRNRFECPDAAQQYAIENPRHTRFIQALSGVVPLDKVGVWQNTMDCQAPMVLMVTNKKGQVARVTRGNPAKDLVPEVVSSVKRCILPSDPGLKSPIPSGVYYVSVDVTTAPQLLRAKESGGRSRSDEGWVRFNAKKRTEPKVLVSQGKKVGESVLFCRKDLGHKQQGVFPSEGVARVKIVDPLNQTDSVESSFYRLRSKEKQGAGHAIEISTNSGGALSLHLVEGAEPKFGRPSTNQETFYELDHIEYFYPDEQAKLPRAESDAYHSKDVMTDFPENKVAQPLTHEEIEDLKEGYLPEQVIDADLDSDIHSELSAIGEHVFDCAVEGAHQIASDHRKGVMVCEEEADLANRLLDARAVADFSEECDQDATRLLKYALVEEKEMVEEELEMEQENEYLDQLRQVRSELTEAMGEEVVGGEDVHKVSQKIEKLQLEELQNEEQLHQLRMTKIQRRLAAVQSLEKMIGGEAQTNATVLVDRLLALAEDRERAIQTNKAHQAVNRVLMEERGHIAGVQQKIGEDSTGQWQDFLDSINELAEHDKEKEEEASEAIKARGVNLTLHADLADLWDRVEEVVGAMEEERDLVDFEQVYDGTEHMYNEEIMEELKNLKDISENIQENAKKTGSPKFYKASLIAAQHVEKLLVEAEHDNQTLMEDYKKQAENGISKIGASRAGRRRQRSSRRRRRRRGTSRRRSRSRRRSSKRRSRSRSRNRSRSRSRARSRSRSRARTPAATTGSRTPRTRSAASRRSRARVASGGRRRRDRSRRSRARRRRRRTGRSQARQTDVRSSQGTRLRPTRPAPAPPGRQGRRPTRPASAGSTRPTRTSRRRRRATGTPPPQRGPVRTSGRRTGINRIPGVAGFRRRLSEFPGRGSRSSGRRGPGLGRRDRFGSSQLRERERELDQREDLLRQRRRQGLIDEREFRISLDELEQQQGSLALQPGFVVSPGQGLQPQQGVFLTQPQRGVLVAPVRRSVRGQGTTATPQQLSFVDNYDQLAPDGEALVNKLRGNVVRPNQETARRGDLYLVQARRTRADLPVTAFEESGRLANRTMGDITADSLVTDADSALEAQQELQGEEGPGDVLGVGDKMIGRGMPHSSRHPHGGNQHSRRMYYRSDGRGRGPYGRSSSGARPRHSGGTYNTGRGPHYNRGVVMDYARNGRSNHAHHGKHSYRAY